VNPADQGSVGERPEATCTLAASVGPYLLHALDPAERAAFERHLDSCEACREDVGNLRGAADALALAPAPVAPPTRLRHAVMAEVRRDAAAHAGGTPRAHRWWEIAGPWRLRPAQALAGAAALVVAGVVAAGLLGSASGGPSTGHSARREVAVRVVGASGYLELAAHSRATLHLHGLPSPGRGRIYEVWIARAGRVPDPTDALFGVNRQGDATVAVPGPLKGARQVLVTDEPSDGSTVPTRPPVVVATL